jgi:hypothetical protein
MMCYQELHPGYISMDLLRSSSPHSLLDPPSFHFSVLYRIYFLVQRTSSMSTDQELFCSIQLQSTSDLLHRVYYDTIINNFPLSDSSEYEIHKTNVYNTQIIIGILFKYNRCSKSHATHIKIFIDGCNSIQFDCINKHIISL